MVVVFIIAILDQINVQSLHSDNLELALATGLLAVVIWVILGYFLVYMGQSKMKKWYELESRIWDQEIFLHLVERYNSIYKQYEALGELKINKLNKIKEDIEY